MKAIIKYFAAIFLLCSIAIQLKCQTLNYEQYKLKNGLQVTLIDYGTIEATSISFYVNAGKKNETPGMQGIASLTASAITFGSAKYNLIKQNDTLFQLGAYISAGANDNFTHISSTFLNRDLVQAMDIFVSALLQPTFPEEEIKQQIEQLSQTSNTNKMDITELASRFTDYFVFGVSNPLGRNSYSEQLFKLTKNDVKEFYDFNYTPKNSRLVIAGKLDKAKIKNLVETYFGNWQAVYGENNQVSLEIPSFNGKQYAFVNRDSATQACMMWTKKAPAANDKDIAAFKVSETIFNYRVMEEVREKLGKTYGIYLSFSEQSNNNIYSISTQTRSKEMTSTMAALEKTMTTFCEKGIIEKELIQAKTFLKYDFMSLNSPGNIINYFNPLVYPDIKKRMNFLNEIDALSIDVVNKAIKKYYNPGSFKLIIAGNETELKTQLSALKDLQKFANKAIEVDK